MKKIIIGCIILMFSALFVARKVIIHWPNELLHIVFCDVGQGDATLLSIGFAQALIDTGPNDSVLYCLEQYMPFWDKQIEVLILTHRDKDHIGGLKYVLDYYSAKYIFVNPSNKKTSDFTPLERLPPSRGQNFPQIITAFSDSVIYLSNSVKIEILWPMTRDFSQKNQKNEHTETTLSDTSLDKSEYFSKIIGENNLSIALKVSFGDVSLFLPGDLEEKIELALLERYLLEQVDILKAGHHGSKSSSTRLFIEKLLPEKIIVSSGKNNQYGHPHPEVLERFEDVKAQVFLTSTSGTLHFVSDMQSVWLQILQ